MRMIKSAIKSAYSLLEANGDIRQPYQPKYRETLTFEQMVSYKIYKNINEFDDQWYMKIALNGKFELVTCSKYSNRLFNTSSASRSLPVFVDFETKLKER